MERLYFDNAATSFPKASGVGEAMFSYITKNGVNVGRASYGQAVEAEMGVLETREKLKSLFNFSAKPTQVIFTPGATWGLNQILRGFLHRGDHVIVSSLEHNAVMRPLDALKKDGIEFSRIAANGMGMSDAKDINRLIRSNTKLVMINHASNVCGAIFPIEEAAQICRERGIALVIDAAQSAGHMPIDFDMLGLSAMCMPGHKGLMGPQGIGVMLLEKSFADALMPIVTGGTGSASDSEAQPNYLPDKFESGTLNLPGIFGLNAAVKYISDVGINTLQEREYDLTAQLLDGLKHANVRIVGPNDAKKQVGVVSVDFRDIDNAEASYRLENEYGIMTRCGLHCAPNAHKTLGTFPQGTVRLSVGHETTSQQVESAVRAVCAVANK